MKERLAAFGILRFYNTYVDEQLVHFATKTVCVLAQLLWMLVA